MKKIVENFSKDLSILLGARMRLIDSLVILSQQSRGNPFKYTIDDLIMQLKKGQAFSRALAHYPKYFDELFINLVEVGEMTGNLSEMFTRIFLYNQRISETKRNLKQALTYPFLILAVASLSLSFIFLYIIPTFTTIFHEFDSDLPWLTQVIFQMSIVFKGKIFYLFCFLFLTFILFRKIENNTTLKKYRDHFILQLPFYGTLIQKNSISLFCRTLGVLLDSGIPFMQSIEIAQKSVRNTSFRTEISRIKMASLRGHKLASSLSQSKLFPVIVGKMISISEETAELPRMMFLVADNYDQDLENIIEMISHIIEPVLIIILGVIIGIVLISVYLPLFNMTNIFIQ